MSVEFTDEEVRFLEDGIKRDKQKITNLEAEIIRLRGIVETLRNQKEKNDYGQGKVLYSGTDDRIQKF